MRTLRPVMPGCALMVLLMFAAIAQTAACSKNQRASTIHASLVAVDAARDGFTTWDAKHQAHLVDDATTREQAEKSIADYRAKRADILDSFELAYRSLALAATQNDKPSLDTAISRAAAVLLTIKKLTEGQ